jgi:hypothetical protein
LAATLAVLVMVGALLPAVAGAHDATAGTHCRKQTETWTRARHGALKSTRGPRVRSHVQDTVSLGDWLVTLQVTGDKPGRYVNVETDAPAGNAKFSHLRTVTLVPVNGEKHTYRTSSHDNNGYVASLDLIKHHQQVSVPIDGRSSLGRATPKLKKVIVTATENCFAAG